MDLLFIFGTYTEPPGLKKNPNIVYATFVFENNDFFYVGKTIP